MRIIHMPLKSQTQESIAHSIKELMQTGKTEEEATSIALGEHNISTVNSYDQECPVCYGNGAMPLTGDTCSTCLGKGQVDLTNSSTFKITQGLTRGKYGSKVETINPARPVNVQSTGWLKSSDVPNIPREIKERYYEVYVE